MVIWEPLPGHRKTHLNREAVHGSSTRNRALDSTKWSQATSKTRKEAADVVENKGKTFGSKIQEKK